LTDLVNLVLTGRKKITGTEDQQASPFELVEYLIKKLDLSKFLQKKYPDDYETRWANIEELKAQTADLTAAMARGEEFLEEEVLPDIEGLEQRLINPNEDALTLFLANIALSSEAQRKEDENPDETQQHVTISTIHAAKGLEWPVVFIPACYEGSIPHSRADDIDEERRLLYVGMTRAQALLYLSYPNKNSQSGETTMSHFLTQRGIEAFFEAQGPKLYDDAVVELARTLRREKPALKQLIEARSTYENPEDAHWPTDGTFPKSENTRWDQGREIEFKEGIYANKRRRTDNDQQNGPTVPVAGFMPASKVTMQNPAGFSTASMTIPPKIVTAASRMQEMNSAQEEARLRDIDARKAPVKKNKAAEGTASIMSFFGKPKAASTAPQSLELTRTSSVPETHAPPKLPASMPRHVSNPLNDISNTSFSRPSRHQQQSAATLPAKAAQISNFKLRTTPSTTKPTSTKSSDDSSTASKPYTFLSSPPPVEPPSSPPDDTNMGNGGGGGEKSEAFRPATTFHATSVAQVGNRVGTTRRLGMGRSFKPWSARGGRGG
ncbi:UvrD-helicase-domain-containing protein, partial [Aureobasidium melanogenum]